MLYDPKWETKTKPDVFSLESLIAWLETMPADGTYNYNNCDGGCLLDLYLATATGKRSRPDPKTHWKTCGGGENYLFIGRTKPQTFGAALSRARALSTGKAPE